MAGEQPMAGQKHALVVIDMLNDFVEATGALTCANAWSIVPKIQEVLAFGRRHGIQVVYIQEAHRLHDADFRVRPVHAVRGARLCRRAARNPAAAGCSRRSGRGSDRPADP